MQFQRRCLPTFSSVRRVAAREQLQLVSLLNYWQQPPKIQNDTDGSPSLKNTLISSYSNETDLRSQLTKLKRLFGLL
jgi:hypothetical protein